jgi:DNA-binding transcriptional LysR family regulator
MPRIDVNRSGEMEAFVQVVESGGFSAAARLLGMTPSAVSKLVARLELRLGIQLVHRSTRKLQLTPEGQQFYERSTRVLADMDEAERCAAAGAAPRGRVSINASVSFGQHKLVPLVPRLLELHPQITLDIALTDRIVDLMDERADIAIRWGQLPSSDLVARRLGETSQAIVASPAYLAKYGTPRTPQELEAHNRWAGATGATARLAAARGRPNGHAARGRPGARGRWRDAAAAGHRGRRRGAAVAVPRAARHRRGPAGAACWRSSTRARWSRSTRCTSARPARCPRGCGRCSTSWWRVRAWATGATRSSARTDAGEIPRSPDRRGGRAARRPTSRW